MVRPRTLRESVCFSANIAGKAADENLARLGEKRVALALRHAPCPLSARRLARTPRVASTSSRPARTTTPYALRAFPRETLSNVLRSHPCRIALERIASAAAARRAYSQRLAGAESEGRAPWSARSAGRRRRFRRSRTRRARRRRRPRPRGASRGCIPNLRPRGRRGVRAPRGPPRGRRGIDPLPPSRGRTRSARRGSGTPTPAPRWQVRRVGGVVGDAVDPVLRRARAAPPAYTS